ncbi:dephospho-CoA kinase [Sinanaerobacter sp. ZZT-01]|uniref:dephospho-CoA kinase n=1 Tax=Sinanaerobacter sp. ZZT-01 TaxID=3111540 RepID=UPI002D7917BF|nr:dephospho-CoA kinase [Sinanaerobacter sp. ZZT-01]WRR93199.1 dephospho-CoA kinase [Sinanaerobacter sp. ZZT-01]
MKVIGLTGGIGSGKSTVSDYLRNKGITVLDADQIAREIVLPGKEALKELLAYFGEEILLENGLLNRKKLGKIVFSDPDKKLKLDQIMHDKIRSQILKKLQDESSQGAPYIILDAPLLLETGMDRIVDQIWIVEMQDTLRISRVMKRDNLTEEEVKARISQQMSTEEKRKKAHSIIDNSSDLENLYAQVDQLLANL